MVQKTKAKEIELNLESEGPKEEMSGLDMDVAKYEDPAFEEEGRKRLHELAQKINALAQESKITLSKIMKEAGQETGMLNKIAHVIKRLKDKAMTDGSSAYNSISFLTSTIKALDWYRSQIPVHISNFQSGIDTLGRKKKEVMESIKTIKKEVKRIGQELDKFKMILEKETDNEKKEILRVSHQEKLNEFQNIEIKGNKSLKELENLNNTTEMFLEMKGGYEILLKQVYNLSEDLKKHKKILEVVGPSVAEVRKVVLTIDKFTTLIGEYRMRDNQEVRLATQAIKEITPAIQNLERPWFNRKTVDQVKQNVKEATKIYKDHFGTDITKLEDYKDKDTAIDDNEAEVKN